MDHVYPPGPSAAPADLTRPNAAYRSHAWLAMAGLALFVLLYFALSAWFSWTAYRLLSGAFEGGDAFWRIVAGVCAAFLAVFMWKALFFVQHRYEIDDLEVTQQQEPTLFAFLHKLADEAGAPRPHRVYLSPRVNAAVFYDLSIVNLIFPSKKNLEIGLALVNGLNLGEMKAVLAHEFGHFAQRSMAVGRWVYIAQQIAGHIIAKRDALDKFLQGLSRFDLRIAWVGWLLSLIVWSIRSIMETVFRIVVLAQRALSREMEFQADLVAVSLTGSDALIHALHRLGAADEAWERALSFAQAEANKGRGVKDLFAIQARVTEKLRMILGDPAYGEPPTRPSDRAPEHRVFKAQLAQPPKMWSTHPTNNEREQNAKRTYIPAAIDERSAWALFSDPAALKERMTAHILRNVKVEAAEADASHRELDTQYARAYFNPQYRGAYLGRSIVRHAKKLDELYNPALKAEHIASELEGLYPESLAKDLERLRGLEEERGALEALRDGFLTAPGGVIQHRGRQLKRSELPRVIEQLDEELEAARVAVIAHDRRCRSTHLAAAAQLGGGWDAYLKGLLGALHYADHAEANLLDAQGALRNVVSVVTADGSVSKRELRRLIQSCVEVHNALRHVYEDEGRRIELDRTLLRRLEVESWRKALGEFGLPLPDESNINQWMQAIDSWVGAAAGLLSALRHAALEQVLLAEAQIARFYRDKMQPGPAPEASRIPETYPLLAPGGERARQKKLGLWDRFHVADGVAPTLARLAVAGGIVAAVVGVGGSVGESSISIYNGLGRPVTVAIGDDVTRVGAFDSTTVSAAGVEALSVRTTSHEGELIESFEAPLQQGYAHYVYNVAGAAPLIEWTATYGDIKARPDRSLGAVRWTTTGADFVFEEAPEQVKSDSATTRDVLSGYGEADPSDVLAQIESDDERQAMIAMHARWDREGPHMGRWLALASQQDGFQALLAARLTETPGDVLTLRTEQDYAPTEERDRVCARHEALAKRSPDDADLQYVAARCTPDGEAQDAAFFALRKRFPENGWIAQAVGYTHAGRAEWPLAIAELNVAGPRVPALADSIGVDLARMLRVTGRDQETSLESLTGASSELRSMLAHEKPAVGGAPESPYFALLRGELARGVEIEGADSARRLRLAAASDGAERVMVEQALALPAEEGVDQHTVWAALALAKRERRETDAYVQLARTMFGESAEGMLAFIDAAAKGDVSVDNEQRLLGLHPAMRGHALSATAVVLGERTPLRWKHAASKLLFAVERPYFDLRKSAADQAAPGVERTAPQLRRYF